MKARTNTANWSEQTKRWRIAVQKDGVRKQFYSSTPGRTGQREANAKADAWLDTGIADARRRVRDVWPEFIADVSQRSSFSNWTRVQSTGDSYVLPLLGLRRICDLDVPDFQQLLDKAYKHGSYCKKSNRTLAPGETLSRKTLGNIAAHCKSFIAWCRAQKLTALQLDALSVPAGARYKGKSVLQPGALTLLFSVDTTVFKKKVVADENINAYRLIVSTGLRPGECLGLEYLDIVGNIIQLRRSINVHNEETAGKNANSIRPVILTPYARRALDAQLQLLRTRGPLKPTTRIFPTDEKALLRAWYRYLKANNLDRITLYELRHTFVSVARLLPDGEVKSIVGHSQSMDTFGVYGHAIADYDQRVADDVSALFSKLLG